ncbi:cell division protein FtsX [Longibacter salinarum]|uniref:Cell division protein FtsX n=1 Tax=Longibacter salinarum TaxID=1850348 RepID=A0A2A8D0I0_9BACT|nr:permease-like cell division protein FtsX [Longibacter salinarum]PEN14394.1 cell division protein FtsX [Longibacter salinarum]
MLPYSIREGIANFRRAKFAVFASTSAMSVALVLVGLFALVTFEAQNVSSWLRDRVGEVEVFVDEDASTRQAEALHTRLKTIPAVASTTFISREEAQTIFAEEFGEGAEIYDDGPFLPASVRLRLKTSYIHTDSISQMAGQIQSFDYVDDVVFDQALLARVQQNVRLVSLAGLVLGAIVILAAIFLVGNTIRLTIYARRLLIRTMKLVGATDAFIRRPFLVEGVLQGLIAGTVASGIVWGLYRLMLEELPDLAISYVVPHAELILVGGLIVGGILLGWVGSFFAVRRFIKSVDIH